MATSGFAFCTGPGISGCCATLPPPTWVGCWQCLAVRWGSETATFRRALLKDARRPVPIGGALLLTDVVGDRGWRAREAPSTPLAPSLLSWPGVVGALEILQTAFLSNIYISNISHPTKRTFPKNVMQFLQLFNFPRFCDFGDFFLRSLSAPC